MNKKGFTLIEVIIVIVILGVLATLALPRITGQIASAEAAEAMNMFGAIKRAAVQCYDSTSTYASCDTQGELGVTVPAGSKFLYTTNAGTATGLVVWARRAASTGNYVMLNLTTAGATTFAADAGGPFVGIVARTGATTATAAAGVTNF